MGIFFSGDVDTQPVEDVLTEAMLQPPLASEADARQQAKVPARRAARSAVTGGGKFETGRFIGAVVIFGVLLGVAVAADALDWVSDPKYLYAFPTTVLGVIVGLLGGEKKG
jgi:hypothetical protein